MYIFETGTSNNLRTCKPGNCGKLPCCIHL